MNSGGAPVPASLVVSVVLHSCDKFYYVIRHERRKMGGVLTTTYETCHQWCRCSLTVYKGQEVTAMTSILSLWNLVSSKPLLIIVFRERAHVNDTFWNPMTNILNSVTKFCFSDRKCISYVNFCRFIRVLTVGFMLQDGFHISDCSL